MQEIQAFMLLNQVLSSSTKKKMAYQENKRIANT